MIIPSAPTTAANNTAAASVTAAQHSFCRIMTTSV
jgi:hypothetical protein